MSKIVPRLLFFIIFVFLAIFYQQGFLDFFSFQFWGIKIYHIVWLLLIIFLTRNLFFPAKDVIAAGKVLAKNYQAPSESFDQKELKTKIRQTNIGVVKFVLVYFFILAILWVLYFIFDLNIIWLYVDVVFFIVLDVIFCEIWCPARDWLMGHKCCNNCRIFNWGYLMVFLPLIVVPNFWYYSLIFLSLIILVQWEWVHYKHPERFYEMTNANLKCVNCKRAFGYCKKKT